jgi:hypothetical protein
VTGSSVVSILISVLFPAPFGPSNPKVAPEATEKVKRSTATSEPYRRVRERTSMTFVPGVVSMDVKVYNAEALDAISGFRRVRHAIQKQSRTGLRDTTCKTLAFPIVTNYRRKLLLPTGVY